MARGRFTNILVIYFVMGAVMWGAGLLNFDAASPVSLVFTGPDLEVATGKMSGIFGTLNVVLGPMVAIVSSVLEFLRNVITFVHWPVFTLAGAGAPPSVVASLGGTYTAIFYVVAIDWFRGTS